MKKSFRCIWIGGWATNINCWQPEIERLYPLWKSEYLDGMSVEDVHSYLADLHRELSPVPTIVVGWSLGSLVLHQFIVEWNLPLLKNCKYISLNPVFNFCSGNGGWSPRVLQKMINKLENFHGIVMGDFFKHMIQGVNISEEQLNLWEIYHGKKHDVPYLISGLKFLQNTTVDIQECLEKCPNLALFAYPEDSIAPPLSIKAWESFKNRSHATSHLPFLTDSPALIRFAEGL